MTATHTYELCLPDGRRLPMPGRTTGVRRIRKAPVGSTLYRLTDTRRRDGSRSYRIAPLYTVEAERLVQWVDWLPARTRIDP